MNLVDLLTRAGVPSEYHEQALKNMELAKERFEVVQPFKKNAWRKMWKVCRELPWEAEQLPAEYADYDNNISINGDRANWSRLPDGTLIRLPVPLEKDNLFNDGGNRFQYYTFKWLPARHWFSRYVWLGWRNRASKIAAKMGFRVEKGMEIKEWNFLTKKEKIEVHHVPALGIWQIAHVKATGPYQQRINLGFKINNLNDIDRDASVTWIPFSFKIRFNGKLN